MSRRVVLAGACAAAIPVAVAAAGTKDDARVELDYDADPELSQCPPIESVREALAAKLGYDPFVGDAEHRIVLRVHRRGTGIEARSSSKAHAQGEERSIRPRAIAARSSTRW